MGTNLRNRYRDNNNNNDIEGQIPEMVVIQSEYTFQSNNIAICFVWMT
jgi:hypothetical protein